MTAAGLQIAVLFTGISAMSMIRHEELAFQAALVRAQDSADSEELAWMVMEHRNLSLRLGGIGAAVTISCGAPAESRGAAMRLLQC